MTHVTPELMDLGNESLYCLCHLLESEPYYATLFYKNYYARLLKDVLQVLSDGQHVSGFKLQAQIVQKLITAVESSSVINP
jgi:exportin-1